MLGKHVSSSSPPGREDPTFGFFFFLDDIKHIKQETGEPKSPAKNQTWIKTAEQSLSEPGYWRQHQAALLA